MPICFLYHLQGRWCRYDGADYQLYSGALGYRQFAYASGQGPADTRRRATIASRHQGRYTDHGWLVILLAVMASTLLWGDLSNPYLWIVSLTTLGFGLVGFADDFLKVRGGSSAGVSGRVKIVLEAIIALVCGAGNLNNFTQLLATSMPFRFSKMCFCPLACPCLCWPACLSLSGLPMWLI